MDLILGRPVRVQPYFGYRSRDRLRISARALRAGKASYTAPSGGAGRLQAMRTMLAQFASREQPDLEIRLELKAPDGQTIDHYAVTDSEGYVHFDIPLTGDWPYPARTMWEIVCLHWFNRNGPQCAEGFVLAPGSDAQVGVISDIDDTIIETGITGGVRQIARNWKRVLAQLPDERIAVPGADAFYGALGGGRVLPGKGGAGQTITATHRPFFYVSSSPWNLFSYLVAFQRSRNLPLGPLMLRDWGLNRETFGASSHGAHKTAAVRTILSTYAHIRFALIGDDTQGDLPAYADVVKAHPGRIAAVFIRTASGPLSPEELAARETIERLGVPLWLGDTYEIGQDFLQEAGVSLHGETAQIVETVENPEGSKSTGQA